MVGTRDQGNPAGQTGEKWGSRWACAENLLSDEGTWIRRTQARTGGTVADGSAPTAANIGPSSAGPDLVATVARVASARYDQIAAAYSARPADYSGGATVALLDLAGPTAGRRILDLACGHGTIARGWPGGARTWSEWTCQPPCS